MKIKISNKWVGDNNPVFVVAEGGINHNGKVKIAKKMVSEAKAAGADAIKFQTFTAEDLTSQRSKFFNLFRRLELDEADFGDLADHSKKEGIIFMSTPFSERAVDLLSSLKVPAFKIASGDLTNIPLIKYAAARKKPLIISTGMANLDEVKDAISAILSVGNNKIILMHSVSSYPTPAHETNLNAIQSLSKKFPYPVGYSDNGNDFLVPLISVAMGTKIIEKHFTINKNLKGPDHKLSADPSELNILIKKIKSTEQMLGDGTKMCQPSEMENRIAARRSITAKITIEKGSRITREMLTNKRPATGVPPKYIHKIIGKIARKKILADESVKWKDVL